MTCRNRRLPKGAARRQVAALAELYEQWRRENPRAAAGFDLEKRRQLNALKERAKP